MASRLTQDRRIAELVTPLGDDVLVLVRYDGAEGLGELFEYQIEAISEQGDINFDKAIGRPCSLKIHAYDRHREFNGVMTEARCLGRQGDFYSYRIVLRPKLWLLTHTADCRIFQEKKVPEILKEILGERGIDFESKLTDEGSYPKREYCVQYRETEFGFLSRLMEEEGIYYFFTHEGGKHVMVLADSKSSHAKVPGLAKLPFLPTTGDFVRKEEHVHEWTSERRFRTGKVELNDYNYLTPNAQMLGQAQGSEGYMHSDMEVFDYPGKYKEKSIGERYAKIRLEAEQAFDRRCYGHGNAVSLFPGGLTALERNPQTSQNVEYLVVRASHSFVSEQYRSGRGGGGAGDEPYFGHYEFQPSDRQFRAPLTTAKPRIHGIQTAKVVCKDDGSSEEIEVEELTEIYVRFYWDRRKMRSCKVRCAQVWSGKKWGGQFIPRVGQEAVIEFVEGDPDRPLVVGTVYNDEYKPPFELPGKKTIAGVKSDSSKGGGGYNEWSFEDKKGSEKITMHAQKDLDVTVLNKETRTIGERFMGAGASRETTLKMGDDKLTVQMGNQMVDVMMNTTHKTGITFTISGGMGISTIVVGPAGVTVNAPMITLLATGMVNVTAGGAMNFVAGGTMTMTAPQVTCVGNSTGWKPL